MGRVDYSGWAFDDLISQINSTYASMPKAVRSKGRNKFVLKIGEILYELKGRLQGEWISQRRKLFPFSGNTALRYCAIFEAVKDNPKLYQKVLEMGTGSIYRELGLNYNYPERNSLRTSFIVPAMNKKEFLSFYIAYSILNGKDNPTIQKALGTIWKQQDYFKEIKDIRDFMESEKEIDAGVKKAVLYAIKTSRKGVT